MPAPGRQLYRWRFGESEFDESTRQFRRNGHPIRIEHKPQQLLSLLLHNAGRVVGREEIRGEVWGNRVTARNTIPTAIGKIRKAIAEGCTISIKTVPRVGYRLEGTLDRIAVGGVASDRLKLSVQDDVPGRPGFTLLSQTRSTPDLDIWLARAQRTQERRVFKFAATSGGPPRLKEEATLTRRIEQSLGSRGGFAQLVEVNFTAPPLFLAYEYPGVELRTWTDSNPRFAAMDRDQRIALFARLCRIVAAVHDLGILHRGLHPRNMLVAEPGGDAPQLELGNFHDNDLLPIKPSSPRGPFPGATIKNRENEAREDAEILYRAPELTQSGAISVRSNIFALGVLLFQILTGDLRRSLTPGWRRAIDNDRLIAAIAEATEQNPARRLDSVEKLARRIETA